MAARAGFPKQVLVLAGKESLFQQAVQRIAGLAADDLALAASLIVGNEEHRVLMLDQLREIKLEPLALLFEPIGRQYRSQTEALSANMPAFQY